jgi:hypothetical protein
MRSTTIVMVAAQNGLVFVNIPGFIIIVSQGFDSVTKKTQLSANRTLQCCVTHHAGRSGRMVQIDYFWEVMIGRAQEE